MTRAPGSRTASAALPVHPRCTCGASRDERVADRGRRLLHLDRAVTAGQVTSSEVAERRVEVLAG
jgi:hypothetical protein